jgi:hypothetical protein
VIVGSPGQEKRSRRDSSASYDAAADRLQKHGGDCK